MQLLLHIWTTLRSGGRVQLSLRTTGRLNSIKPSSTQVFQNSIAFIDSKRGFTPTVRLYLKASPLLRFTKRKLSRALRKWLVYFALAGLAGNSARVFEHFSLLKPWRIAKGVAAYLMTTL